MRETDPSIVGANDHSPLRYNWGNQPHPFPNPEANQHEYRYRNVCHPVIDRCR